MAYITLTEHDLVTRSNRLYKLFSPLRGDRKRVALQRTNGVSGGFLALAASDMASDRLNYREAYFHTSVEALRCRYFELWSTSGGGSLILNRAYFTLVQVDRTAQVFRDILCLHTDPGGENRYKQGPHLHISCAEQPIPHCHFPLDLGCLDIVLENCDALTDAMQRAIQIVATDVLHRYVDIQP